MYRPQSKKFSATKAKKKKFSFFPENSDIFDEDPIEFNDLDSNLLNRNLIKFLPTDSLRLELQLERAEKKLNKVDEELKTAKMLGIEENTKEEILLQKKKQLISEINSYKSEYRQLGLIYLIADAFSDIRIKLIQAINNIKSSIVLTPLLKNFFEKLPGYSEKQKLEKMNLLQKKIFKEMKNQKPDSKKLENLFLKKEELDKT